MLVPSFEIASLRAAFLGGEVSAAELLDRALTRIAEWDDPALWIARPSESVVRDRARALDTAAAADPGFIERTPLFGGMSRRVLKFARQTSLVDQATRPWLAVQGRGW